MTGVVDISLVTVIFLGLLIGGLWIPFAIGITGLVYLLYSGGLASLRALGLVSWGGMNSFTLTAIPLFIFMAELLLRSGLSHQLYRGLAILVRRLPGGLLQTNIAGCALFAAISGSSVVTAAAIGTVAMPRLQERHYDLRMATGSIAAGGTLGILIPPSIAMILYGTFTESSISQLFAAGLIPGVVLTMLFMAYIAAHAMLRPAVAPKEAEALTASIVLRTVGDLLPFTFLIVAVLGAIFLGLATPTEAAALGCSIAIVVCLVWGELNFRLFREALQHSVRVSGVILFIVLAAYIFSYSIGISGLGATLTNALVALQLDRYAFLAVLFIMYAILGCLVDSISMMVITVPLLHPVLVQYGIDTVWFGVILVLLIELGQITPPLGINLFVIQGIWSGPLGQVVLGTVPYYFIILVFLLFLTWWPEIALWLPAQISAR